MKSAPSIIRRGALLGILALTTVHGLPAADLHVPADHATIQAAVDAAANGDTIDIAPGVYVEQVRIIGKILTLIGQPGTILRAFPGMEPGFEGPNWVKPIIFVNSTEHVTIRSLSFEGDQLAAENPPGVRGVWIDGAGGSVEGCRFTGFREKTPGSGRGDAILFWNAEIGAERYQARVSDTTIVDCYNGIYIQGVDAGISYDVTLTDNVIAGVGLTTAGDLLQGIHIGDGTTGSVVRNTISGFAYDGLLVPGSHPIPFGILRLSEGFPDALELEPMTFEGNVFSDNQVHLASFKADNSVVRNNTFERNVPFTQNVPPLLGEGGPVALWFTGADVQVTGNQFRDLDHGILLAAQADLIGIATDAMLIDNRFCEVETEIITEPGATFTEEGTLTCPFPPPDLQLDHVVLLSWPAFYEGWVPECSPDLVEWGPLAGPRITHEGMVLVPVPIEGPHKFFRLVDP